MDCVGINPGNIYLWICLAGILTGGGFSFLLCLVKRRKPAVASVLLSFAILFLLAAAIISGFSLKDYGLKLSWLGVSAVAGFLCFMFWKAAGIPILFLLVIFTIGAWYSFSGWSCAEPGAEICRFRTISEGDDFVRIQYEDAGGNSGIIKVQGANVYPLLDIVTIPDYFFILNNSRIYKFHGFGVVSGSGSESNVGLSGLILNRITDLPGFIIKIDSSEAIKFSPSLEYMLLFGDDGEPEISRQI